MKMHALALGAIALFAFTASTANAQRVRGGFENATGGVTAGGAHDVRGAFGGRAVGEGGVVTDGDGNGVSGSHGCGRTGAGGAGCGQGTTSWDNDGNVDHQQSGYARGRYGNTASTDGNFSRDEDGDWNGQRDTQVNVGNRSYDIDTSFDSDDGWDRDVNCSGSGCPD